MKAVIIILHWKAEYVQKKKAPNSKLLLTSLYTNEKALKLIYSC